MAGSLWLLVVFKNPLLWALHSKQLPLEFYVHILKQNGFATSQVYKSQSSPINVYFYSSMQDRQSREACSAGLHLCGLYYPKIRELEQACLQQPTSTRSGLFAFLGSCYGQISFQRIVSIRITTLGDTHLVASRYNKVENTSLSRLMNIAQIHLCLSSLQLNCWQLVQFDRAELIQLTTSDSLTKSLNIPAAIASRTSLLASSTFI